MVFGKTTFGHRAKAFASGILSMSLFLGVYAGLGAESLLAAENDAAKIGNTGFATLGEAIADAKPGETITLVSDCSSANLPNIGKNLTIDLNGHTYKDTNNGLYPFAVTDGAIVTIKDSSADANGKFVHQSKFGIYAYSGDIVIESGNIETESTYAVSVNSGSITVKGGTITEKNADGYAVYAFNKYEPTIAISGGKIVSDGYGVAIADCKATVDISGGEISAKKFALSTNGSAKTAADVTISGGKLTSDTIAVYQPSGNFTIKGGDIEGNTAVYIKSGNLSILGGSIIANGEKSDYVYAADGATATGDALVIDNCGYPNGEPKVSINRGIFTSANAKSVGTYANGDLKPVEQFISGGTFSDPVSDVNCAEDYTPITNPDGTYTVTNNASKNFGDFIERLYNVALDRESEADGKKFWMDAVQAGQYTGGDCASFFLTSDEFKGRNLDNETLLKTLYKTFFDREPDEEGFPFWLNYLNEGHSSDDVIQGFINSPEWCNLCASYGVKSGAPTAKATVPSNAALAFAERLYTKCLGRASEDDGLMYWALALTNLEWSGAEAAREFFLSPEYVAKNASDDDYLTALYRTFMGREPEAEGFQFWQGTLKAGTSRLDVLRGFAASPEFTDLCNVYGINRGDI